MHYKNGREAKNGDRIVMIQENGGLIIAGILYNATPGNDCCNGRLAVRRHDDPYPNLKECLHEDDVRNGNFPLVQDTPPTA